MSLIGDTKLEILEILAEEPNHGYALHQHLGVTTSTIYQHLDELEEAGMVSEQKPAGQTDDRVLYALTADGKKLRKLLAEDTDE